MTIHQMKLASGPFQKIASGEKVIESRLYDEKRKLIHVGDRIQFTDSDNPRNIVKVSVLAVYRHPSFESLFSTFPASTFGGGSKESLLEEIRQLYSSRDEKSLGVVGIYMEKIK